MPKQIKKPQAKQSDITFRKWALAAFVSAVLFGTAFGVLIKSVLDSGKPVPMTVLFCTYVVYLVTTALAAWKGVQAYAREDAGAALLHGILLGFSSIFALVNIRLAIVMLLEAFKKTETSKKLIGEQSVSDFINSQRTAWVLLAIGMALCVMVGVLAIVKLISSRKSK